MLTSMLFNSPWIYCWYLVDNSLKFSSIGLRASLQTKSHLHEKGIYEPKFGVHKKASITPNLTSTKRHQPAQISSPPRRHPQARIWPPQKGIYQSKSHLHKKASTTPNLAPTKRHLPARIWPPQKGIYQISLHKKVSTSLNLTCTKRHLPDRISLHKKASTSPNLTFTKRHLLAWIWLALKSVYQLESHLH